MPSTPASDRFARLTDLFRRACSADAGGRIALLEDTRTTDPDLAAELEALLAADDTVDRGAFLDPLPGVGEAVRRAAHDVASPAGQDVAGGADDSASASGTDDRPTGRFAFTQDHSGRQLGDFTLERLIARGGMGAVYLARQSNPDREVAIKLLRDELPSSRQRQRFRLEADVLARLQHPGIATIHAAGTSEQHPWLAMEYIAGARPITHHANEHDLDTRRRVRAVREVADAVRHAHQRGVIHRDLKPANLVVGEDGRVRVIDFGVARADALSSPTSGQTAAGELLGTLAYMSPEQCAGAGADAADAVDVRSDIYALGIVLHELLTGRRPHELQGLSLGDAIRRVSHAGVPPITETAPGLEPDLQCIIQVATSLDPADRYQSADALIADLDRWLAGEPIAARPPGPIRRVRLFVRRNKALSALIGSGTLAAAGIAIVILLFTVRLAEESRATRIALDRSERMLGFLAGVLGSGSDRHTDSPTRDLAEMLTVASRQLDVEFQDDPAGEYRLREALGLSWQTMGDRTRALEEFDRQAELARTMPGASPRQLALAKGHRAKVLYELDQRDAAEQEYREAVTLYRSDPAADPSAALAAEQSLAIVEATHDPLAGSRILRELFDTSRRATGGSSFRTVQLKESLAMALVREGRSGEAETMLRDVLVETDRMYRGPHPQRIDVRNNLGWALINQGRFDEAIVALDEALAMSLDLFGPRHPRTTWIRGTRLDALVRRGVETAEDVEDAARALLADRLETLGPRSHAVALSEGLLWRILLEQGRVEEALPLAQSAHARTLEVLGPDQGEAARTAQLVGLTLNRLGRTAEATAMLEEARDIVDRASGPGSREAALAGNELAIAYAGAGRWEDALAQFERARAIYERSDVANDPELIKAIGNMGRCLLELGRLDAAHDVLSDASGRAAEVFDSTAMPRVMIEASYGEVLAGLGRMGEGLARLEAVRPRLEQLYPPGAPRLARIQRLLDGGDAEGAGAGRDG